MLIDNALGYLEKQEAMYIEVCCDLHMHVACVPCASHDWEEVSVVIKRSSNKTKKMFQRAIREVE